MSEKFTLPSGAKFEVTPLPYLKAWGVTQKIAKSLEKLNIDIKSIDPKNIKVTDVLDFKNPICAILADEAIIEAARECFTRCTYNGLKIDDDTFESVKARCDFLPCVFYALKVNISPFFSNLISFFSKD